MGTYGEYIKWSVGINRSKKYDNKLAPWPSQWGDLTDTAVHLAIWIRYTLFWLTWGFPCSNIIFNCTPKVIKSIARHGRSQLHAYDKTTPVYYCNNGSLKIETSFAMSKLLVYDFITSCFCLNTWHIFYTETVKYGTGNVNRLHGQVQCLH